MTAQEDFRLADEQARLDALRRYEILDSLPEEEFQDLVELVQSIFNAEYVGINLIDGDRQWTKASAGVEDMDCRREDAFCDYTIRARAPFVIGDTEVDPRFSGNPFVTGETSVRSYLGAPLTSPDGYNIGALCIMDTQPRHFSNSDVQILGKFAKLIISQMELRLIAGQDSLTKALRRRAFLQRVDTALVSGKQGALILLDLDHFKSINDIHGHLAGDAALRRVAVHISGMLRDQDCIGRLGGEEFGVLARCDTAESALALADRLRGEVEALEIPELCGSHVTVSIGVAMNRHGDSRDMWYARADEALYVAKHDGRNRCVLAD